MDGLKKILIIDDSALMRRVLSDIIETDNRFQVMCTKKNGEEAWEYLSSGQIPDGILLDLNMPVLDGIGLLKRMQQLPEMPKVIIVSTIAHESGSETIQALGLGAYDFVKKPEDFVDTKSGAFRDRLIQTVVAMLFPETLIEKKDIEQAEKMAMPVKRLIPRIKATKGKRLVVIACSTGGPKALQNVIPEFPVDFPYPIVVIQHMPEGFTASLARRLDDLSLLHVKEAEEEEVLESGNVYIARGGKQLRIRTIKGKNILHLSEEETANRLKPCADLTFDSLEDSDFEQIACVVLTGMGADGTRGIQKLDRKKNLFIVSQNEATSLVYGMPRMIAMTGLVDEIVPLDEVTKTIVEWST